MNNTSDKYTAIVVCPLKTLVRDQVFRWRKRGVKASAILPKGEMTERDMQGFFSINMNICYIGWVELLQIKNDKNVKLLIINCSYMLRNSG